MRIEKVRNPSVISLDDSLILEGDVFHVLSKLPDESVQCVITSPPYWGLRDYGYEGQIGLETTLHQFINRLVAVFGEIRRVLKKDGTLWLNIGDGYTSGNRGYRAPDKKNPARAMSVRPDTPEGLKPKDLLGIPWRLAFALQDDGWYLRSDIVWNKPNALPESVKDRPTRSHEFLFLLSKSSRRHSGVGGRRQPQKPAFGLVCEYATHSVGALRNIPHTAYRTMHPGFDKNARLRTRSVFRLWNCWRGM